MILGDQLRIEARLAVARHVYCQIAGIGHDGLPAVRVAAEVGGLMLIIDGKNKPAANWYESYGAVRLNDKPLTLALSFSTLERELKAAG